MLERNSEEKSLSEFDQFGFMEDAVCHAARLWMEPHWKTKDRRVHRCTSEGFSSQVCRTTILAFDKAGHVLISSVKSGRLIKVT